MSLEAVFSELLFQKSLLVEGAERYREIDRYLQIAQSIPDAEHHSIKDPFEKSIAIIFELVIANQMDPRSIDIVQFTRLYTERIKKEGTVNFIVAGKLILLAWNVLRLESERLVSAIKQEEPMDVDPDFFHIFDDALPEMPEFELYPAIRPSVRREVNIMDLLDAFAEAQKEIEKHLSRASRITLPPQEFRDTAHREDAEKDINALMERIASLGPGPVALSDLAADREETVTFFLSMLFLVKLGRLRAWQENAPGGEIYMEIVAPAAGVEMQAEQDAGQET